MKSGKPYNSLPLHFHANIKFWIFDMGVSECIVPSHTSYLRSHPVEYGRAYKFECTTLWIARSDLINATRRHIGQVHFAVFTFAKGADA